MYMFAYTTNHVVVDLVMHHTASALCGVVNGSNPVHDRIVSQRQSLYFMYTVHASQVPAVIHSPYILHDGIT